jgi:hypothetical protein
MKLLSAPLMLSALLSAVTAEVYVFNDCPFPVSYYGDAQTAGPGVDVSGIIQPGGVYPENITVGGRALKLWPSSQSGASLLVFGYTNNDGSPFVW